MKISKGFIYQKLGDETVIFDGEKSILYTLNHTAGFIFNKLKKGESIENIAKQISRNYGITKESAIQDVTNTITKLKKIKAISNA